MASIFSFALNFPSASSLMALAFSFISGFEKMRYSSHSRRFVSRPSFLKSCAPLS